VIERKLMHPNNPVLNWNMANAVVRVDPASNRKLDKEKARFRIDGAVALTMLWACARATARRRSQSILKLLLARTEAAASSEQPQSQNPDRAAVHGRRGCRRVGTDRADCWVNNKSGAHPKSPSEPSFRRAPVSTQAEVLSVRPSPLDNVRHALNSGYHGVSTARRCPVASWGTGRRALL